MPTIKSRCQYCFATYTVDQAFTGRPFQCSSPKCGKTFKATPHAAPTEPEEHFAEAGEHLDESGNWVQTGSDHLTLSRETVAAISGRNGPQAKPVTPPPFRISLPPEKCSPDIVPPDQRTEANLSFATIGRRLIWVGMALLLFGACRPTSAPLNKEAAALFGGSEVHPVEVHNLARSAHQQVLLLGGAACFIGGALFWAASGIPATRSESLTLTVWSGVLMLCLTYPLFHEAAEALTEFNSTKQTSR